MTAKRVDRRAFEDPAISGGAPLKVFAAVAFFGLALLLVYLSIAAPQPGTGMGAIQNALYGMGGNLALTYIQQVL